MTPPPATLTRTPTPISNSPRCAFSPTPAQRRLLDHIHANPGFQTVQEICAAAGVDPSSYYRWCHDPGFRAWLSHEWSSCLLFEGWHMLNLARANMVRSATHFRALFSLVFDPRGQAALDGWQTRLASDIASISQSNQSLDPENESFLKLAEAPSGESEALSETSSPRPLNPTRILRHLEKAIENSSAPVLEKAVQ